MYELLRLYWDWIVILLLHGTYSVILLLGSLLIRYFNKTERRLYGYKCLACSSGRLKVAEGSSIRDRLLSTLNIIGTPIEDVFSAFKPSSDRQDRSCLFDEERHHVCSEFTQETPLGRVRLVMGISQDWSSGGIESFIYSGTIDTGTECWMLTSSYSISKGGMHPLEIEFLMASCVRFCNICPEPLYVSIGFPGIYGSFTKVEERYMLYEMPVNSEFITKLAFKNRADHLKHLKACCAATIALLSTVREMHTRGISHGALDDDAVVIVGNTKILLINLARVSTDLSQQFSDIITIFEIFSYIVSRGFTRSLHELRGIQYRGRPCIHSGLHGHIDEMQSMKSSSLIPSHEQLMKCFMDFERRI
jgi:hypothetical protein